IRDGSALELPGLSREDVGRLVEQVAGTAAVTAKVNAIHEATEGNPLFVREVTRLVASHDQLDRPGRITIAVPRSVRSVIRRRIAPLSADAVRVLSAAAVVGRDFDLRLVGSASDLPDERVIGSLSEAMALGLVSEDPSAIGVYRFAHPLMREVMYEELPIPVRIQLHRLVGEALERLRGQDPRLDVSQLAYQFSKVAPAGDVEKALDY